ncbi:hypothetical protein GJ744_005021 [Endocarpon pusillum]|uniref:D-arabinitol 2-dehydrogenase n=1 Tax=Endocarpon pusillum TaxID=364733 RepID=A0A8H7A626_9EURO|nr:hypothetical protein GJ744_005021 [Endocarpon pusillum]
MLSRTMLSRASLLPRIARRRYRSHGADIFYPPSRGVAPLIESESKSRRRFHKQHTTADVLLASTETSNSPSVKNALRPSSCDPAAESSMRMTQPLSSKVMTTLSPTFQRFALKDKVAIVTGGARGLGLNMTQALCESGIKAVAIFDIQPTLGESMAAALSTSTGIPVKYYNVDVVDEESVDSAVQKVATELGQIDILINSAGVAFSNIPAERYKMSDFEKTININLMGSFRIARAVGRHMIAATATRTRPASSNADLPDRSIILIASMSGTIVNYPQPQAAYNASKAGVIQLSKSLASEWARYGIRVNTISPGYMDTALNRVPALEGQKEMWKERTPMGRLGAVEELNGLVVWLAGEGGRFCTGADLRVDGGYSIW